MYLFREVKLLRGVKAVIAGFSILTPLLIGCGVSPGRVPAAIMAALQSPVATSAAQYRAYGDSITFGETLSGSQRPYPAFVAENEQVTYADNAIPGDQACDVSARQIFPNEDAPTLASHPTYSLLIGTNDVFDKGVGPYEAVFKACHLAAVSWLAIPAEHKILATSNAVTTTGANTIDNLNHWNAWTGEAKGASISFTITTPQDGPIYAWPLIIDGSNGTYNYSIDGLIVGSGEVGTNPEIATRNGTSTSLGFLRLPPVPAGIHVVTFTQTSDGVSGVSVVGVGFPAQPSSNQLPTVLAGTIPYQLPGTVCDASDGPCQNYINDIEADVDLLSKDGLTVRIFDTRQFMLGTAPEMNDQTHPNELGQYELSKSVESVWLVASN
ncbi:hypothetical protein HNQ77_003628 [Silvibacterium bohemicum]|uniref:Uncharacterized protein n=1 Tax=Silvibacterium bohemicum TaxID=1577686 RepID=A0A841JZ42_9BACT|nr:SGNH/GDSL hydrolase family protein [Silvibacterium bohemicum]MBB6145667.1 hypothetical protein [Silvibacterium bohemicum]